MFRNLIHFIFVLFVLAAAVAFPARWMIERSYHDPETHYYRIEDRDRKPDSGEIEHDSLRFAVVSDLYNYVFEGGNSAIAQKVSDISPDAILVCGNMITPDASGTSVVSGLVKSLSQIAPVYYSYGEEEIKYAKAHLAEDGTDPLRAAIEEAGGTVLNEEYKDVSLYGVLFRVGSIHQQAYELQNLRGEVKKRFQGTWDLLNKFQDTERFKILMTDGPESFIYGDACEKWSVDLVVSGKTLGGKAVIPFKGGVFGGSQGYFPEYVHGLYKKGDVILFITSGLSAPEDMIPRFNNPPEVVVMDINGIDSDTARKAEEEAEKARKAEKKKKEEEKKKAEEAKKESDGNDGES